MLVENTFSGADNGLWVNFPVLNGSSNLAHDHEFAEIVLIGGGHGQHVSIFGKDPLSRGDCLILTPGVWHDFEDCEDLQVANCCFRPSLVSNELGAILNDNAIAGLLDPSNGATPSRLRLDSRSTEQGLRYIRVLETLQDQQPSAARLEARAHFLMLLGLISRSLTDEERALWSRAARWPAAVRESILRLESDLARDWSLADLAGAAHLDPAYFVRLFKGSVGEPPLHYLARRRAESAAALLLSTALPIGEIGTRVGWDSPAYFSRRFKAHFGMSANEFRQRRSLL